MTPSIRIRTLNDRTVRDDGEYVLYWMNATRRANWNYAMDRAVEWCVERQRPLLVFEALRVGYRWASDRLHRFILQGMAENSRRLKKAGVEYFPYVEEKPGEGKGLFEALAQRAVVVVTDDFPCFFLPRMISAAAQRVDVLMEAVDSNGLLPMRAAGDVYPTAYAFRRFLQKNLAEHLLHPPKAHPFPGLNVGGPVSLPSKIRQQWPAANERLMTGDIHGLAELPIDHSVGPAVIEGGSSAAEAALRRFLSDRLPAYAERRNQPQEEVASGFSPYLHFGFLSPHEVFREIVRREKWDPERLAAKANGSREGWWGMSEESEAFLDEMITWREVGYNFCSRREDYDQYDSLPGWAKASLHKHAGDERPRRYSLAEFESAGTHDSLWNAAQRQLVREGRMHNYLRMLWGKKILEWSKSPEDALATMIELNNKYAVDGRNPNSYSGVFWVLGRYDRPWAPERPIFGVIRYMSSDNTARKLRVKDYVQQYAP